MIFIKLSNVIINTSKITSIRIHNNKYFINVLQTSIHGSYLGFFGSISSSQDQFEIDKETRNDDYNIITNWIKKNTKSET